MRLPASLAAACLALTLALSGCIAADEPGGDAREGGSIEVGTSAFPARLDPALATDPGALQLLWLVYTPLLTYRHAEGQEGTEPVPGLARARPAVSEDGLTYVLRLRGGLRYSNGTPVRAGDFERAVDRVRALRSPLRRLYAAIASIDA
ncbi:MAG: ABC transporter substrate-binding protein, partial [Pseudonocardiaceae bacterium]